MTMLPWMAHNATTNTARVGGCRQSQVAVCITGQLRGSSRSGTLARSAASWRQLGTNCVDIFLVLGMEGNEGSYSMPAGCRPNTVSSLQAVLQLQPKLWRIMNGTEVISIKHGADMQLPISTINSTCRKPADWNHLSSVMCGPGHEITNCSHAMCTHCDWTASRAFLPPQRRRHMCLADVIAQEAERDARYRFVVVHRPEFRLGPLPPLERWASLFGAANAAHFCNVHRPPHIAINDFFVLTTRPLMRVMQSLLGEYEECTSRQVNTKLGLPNDWRWPYYFGPEAVMHSTFLRNRVATVKMPRWQCNMRSIDNTCT